MVCWVIVVDIITEKPVISYYQCLFILSGTYCRYCVEKYVMNENKDKLSLMDGEQPPIYLGVAIIKYRRG